MAGQGPALAAEPLTQHLQWWLRHLTPDKKAGLVHRVLTLFRGTKWTIVACLVPMALALVDLIVDYTNTSKFQARYAIGVYSCIVSQYVFDRRLHVLTDALKQLVSLLQHLEGHTHPESQERMARTARRSARLIRFFVTYSLMSEIVVPAIFLVVHQGWPAAIANLLLWPLPPHHAEAVHPYLASSMRWMVLFPQLVSMFCSIHSYYTLMLCLLVVYGTTADLFDALGRALQETRCHARWPWLQAQLLPMLLGLDSGLADVLPHLLVTSVVLPLLSTVEVALRGVEADVFAVLMAPLVLMVFVPLCEIGDTLAAARRGVMNRAAAGPWLEEAPWQRRLRCGLMQASQGGGARLRGKGIGLLNRPTCGNALRSWFSFLQVLVNVQGRGASN